MYYNYYLSLFITCLQANEKIETRWSETGNFTADAVTVTFVLSECVPCTNVLHEASHWRSAGAAALVPSTDMIDIADTSGAEPTDRINDEIKANRSVQKQRLMIDKVQSYLSISQCNKTDQWLFVLPVRRVFTNTCPSLIEWSVLFVLHRFFAG